MQSVYLAQSSQDKYKSVPINLQAFGMKISLWLILYFWGKLSSGLFLGLFEKFGFLSLLVSFSDRICQMSDIVRSEKKSAFLKITLGRERELAMHIWGPGLF